MTTPTLSAKKMSVVDKFLDERTGVFRRSDIVKALYPTTVPRSEKQAEALADASIKKLRANGRIARHGHRVPGYAKPDC